MTVDFSPLDISCLKDLGSLQNLFSIKFKIYFLVMSFQIAMKHECIMDHFSSTNEFLSQLQYLFSSFSSLLSDLKIFFFFLNITYLKR